MAFNFRWLRKQWQIMLLQAIGVLGLHAHNLVELEYEPGAEAAVEEIVLDVQRKNKDARSIYVQVRIE